MRWVQSKRFDLTFILSPPFLAVAIALWFGLVTTGHSSASISPRGLSPFLTWIILVVGIDVAHVYSTFFRTYFVRQERKQRPMLYFFVPIICWVLGTIFYSLGPLVFWSVLAYLAVFHFVRQQYGFMMIYSEASAKWERQLHQALIYLATLYPLVFWHHHLKSRNYTWFVEGDFRQIFTGGFGGAIEKTVLFIYMCTLVVFVIREVQKLIRGKTLNLQLHLLFWGTAASWFVGIVFFNNDFIFTLTNIVTHGVPYAALVWVYGRKTTASKIFQTSWIPLFLLALVSLAFFEEGLWDFFIWREQAFWVNIKGVGGARAMGVSNDMATWLVPLLALPQSTHYVLDGFIWKRRDLAKVL